MNAIFIPQNLEIFGQLSLAVVLGILIFTIVYYFEILTDRFRNKINKDI